MDSRLKHLLDLGDKAFSNRLPLLSLWQEIAENFYPERADFTVGRSVGEEFATHLDTSAPILARRDLGNNLGALLRPPGKIWAKHGIKRDGIDEEGRRYLEMTERVQRRTMYDRNSGFIRATKEGDHDFAAFGQCVLSSEFANHPQEGAILLHRAWHIRDTIWLEDSYGKISHTQRKWKPQAWEYVQYFPKTAHDTVRRTAKLGQDPMKEIEVRHIVIASHLYNEKKFRTPWVSIFIDVDNQHPLEEVGSWTPYYIIPRWQTVSGSQYAYSPATVAALADARLIQAMTYTLLSAGEWAVEPPLVGKADLIKGSIEAMPGGFTAIDASYDERLGEIIRPLNKGGERAIPIGLEMLQDIRRMIVEAFYLNRLSLPGPGLGGMSPLEVSQRIEEYIRQALPLFEPMESEYNGALMDQNFDILMRNGAFGPPSIIPESLRGQEIEFTFESPIKEATERIKVQKFVEAKDILAIAAQLDPISVRMVDVKTALRDALHGNHTPSDWLLDEDQMAQIEAQAEQVRQMQAMAETASTGGQVVEQIGKAGQAVNEAVAPEAA